MSDDLNTDFILPDALGESETTASPPDAAVAIAAPEGDGAPRITATGRGAMAEKILEIAFANGVKVREDPDLAAFLSTLDVDNDIPVDALAAVAEILTYIYRTMGTPAATAPEPEALS